jgi:hypothetical protein
LTHGGTDEVAGLAAVEAEGVFVAVELCGFAAGLGAAWDHATGRAATNRRREIHFMIGDSPTEFSVGVYQAGVRDLKGDLRAVPEFTSPLRSRERWRFLKENATWLQWLQNAAILEPL